VLGSIFELEDSIRESDQGRSFFAFWQLMTDVRRSEKLSAMLENLYALDTIVRFDPRRQLRHHKFELLERGEKVAQVTTRLIEQLRRYIDDRAWVENRRILQLCRSIEKQALALRESPPKARRFTALPGMKASIGSIASKSLYRPRRKTRLVEEIVLRDDPVPLDDFYRQCYVDEALLRNRIETVLQERPVCTLCDVVSRFGVDKGVAELVGYLSLATSDPAARVDETADERVSVRDFDGNDKVVVLPKIVFTRSVS
jgi:hypothetical protein